MTIKWLSFPCLLSISLHFYVLCWQNKIASNLSYIACCSKKKYVVKKLILLEINPQRFVEKSYQKNKPSITKFEKKSNK